MGKDLEILFESLIFIPFSVAFLIFYIIGKVKLFQKAGKNGW